MSFFETSAQEKQGPRYLRTVQPPSKLLLAIAQRKLVAFEYDAKLRIVEPHICGVMANGRTVLAGYQTGVGTEAEWRTFSVEKILLLHVAEETFAQNRPEYDPGDSRYDTVYARV